MSNHPWADFFDVKLGSKISVKQGDTIWTQTVDSISYSTQPYVTAPRLSRRERIVRWLTPHRWRKPLPQPSGVPVVTIKTTDPMWRAEPAGHEG